MLVRHYKTDRQSDTHTHTHTYTHTHTHTHTHIHKELLTVSFVCILFVIG